MARATTRDVTRDANGGDVSALEQEVFALRKELRLLQLANEELERLVVRDTLTPLFNRRHFVSCLADRLSRLERYGSQAALVFIDVNEMKRINDSYGHSAGDFALLHIARLLASSIRSTDIAARVGGDEFALLLDGVTEEGAIEKATQLARVIAESQCRFGDDVLPLSASFGCTALRAGDSDFAAIARADMAMYAAKRRMDQAG
ncbi:MAG: GGDEF domain-containing protein [Sphingomonadales bacterium]|nr:GGDEF domain-containing protein [Sphingomonadales bacterium]